jgi:hypothetical protein
MKHRFLQIHNLICAMVLLFSMSVYGQTVSPRDQFINDYAQILNSNLESDLQTRLEFHNNNKNVKISVLTLSNFEYQNDESLTWQQFSHKVFADWQARGFLADNSILVIVDKNTNQIKIEIGSSYPIYYQDLTDKLINSKSDNATNVASIDLKISETVGSLIELTLNEVSFFQWYKWEFLGAFYLLLSLLIAFLIRNNQNAPLPLLIFSIFGVFMLATYNSIFNTSTYGKTNVRRRA